MINEIRQKASPILVLAFACFIALGVAASLLGVAWPSIRATFNLSLDTLAILLGGSTVGFVIGSVLAGRLMIRAGVGTVLLVTNLIAGLGLIGYAIAPGWWFLVAFSLLTGFASGAIDTGLNIYMAAYHGVAVMNWMHACFGIGATLGPLLMTAILQLGLDWQLGYVSAAIIHLTLAFSFLLTRHTLRFKSVSVASPSSASRPVRPAKPAETLRIPAVLLSIVLFLLYTGVESSTGQWSYSLFTESRNVSTSLAGLMTSVFWGMLTFGRIFLGAIADRFGVQRLLRFSMLGVLLSALLFIVQNTIVGFLAIGLMGFSLSAIFPTLTSDTPNRVGLRHTPNSIGYQTGAASVGFAALPGLVGIIAERAGLETLGIFLVITSSMMLITNEIILYTLRHRKHAGISSYSESPLD